MLRYGEIQIPVYYESCEVHKEKRRNKGIKITGNAKGSEEDFRNARVNEAVTEGVTRVQLWKIDKFPGRGDIDFSKDFKKLKEYYEALCEERMRDKYPRIYKIIKRSFLKIIGRSKQRGSE